MSGLPSDGLWAMAPYKLKSLPGDKALVVRTDNGAVAVIESQWRPLLASIQTFRSLPDHVAAVLGRNPKLQPHRQALERVLSRLSRERLLVSGAEVLGDLPKPNAPMEERSRLRIAITTCDRPLQLERLLDSLVDNERRYGNHWTYEVVDDSRRSDSTARNRALVDRYRAELALRYHGLDDRRALLERLRRSLPEHGDALAWLLDSGHPSHAGHGTYGCTKNYLMLLHAGARLLMIDDDAIVKAWRAVGATNRLRFDRAGLTRRVAADIETLQKDLQPAPADPIAEQAAMLGEGVAQPAARDGCGETAADLLGLSTADQVLTLDWERARIRATMSSLLGDPGTAVDLGLLYQDREALRAAADDNAYGALRSQPRAVFTGKPWWTLTRQRYFLLATMAGIDLAPYAPPLMPSGRGEDSMLAVLLPLLYPMDVAAVSPSALEHRPDPPRDWRTAPSDLVGQLSPAGGFCIWASPLLAASLEGNPRDKLAALRDHFLRAASSEGGRRRLQAAFTAATKQTWAHVYGEIAAAYSAGREYSGRWKAEVTDTLTGLQQLLSASDVLEPAAMARLIDWNRRYFEALDGWNSAYDLMSAQADTAGRG